MDGTSKLFRNDYSRMELDGPVSVTDAGLPPVIDAPLLFMDASLLVMQAEALFGGGNVVSGCGSAVYGRRSAAYGRRCAVCGGRSAVEGCTRVVCEGVTCC